jgi:hypothetical protein
MPIKRGVKNRKERIIPIQWRIESAIKKNERNC